MTETMPEAVSAARDRLEEAGVLEPSLTPCFEAVVVVWGKLEAARRPDLFEPWLDKLLATAQSPSVKAPAALLVAALTRNGQAQALFERLLEGREQPSGTASSSRADDDRYRGVRWCDIEWAVQMLSIPEHHDNYRYVTESVRTTAEKCVFRKLGMTLEEARELVQRRNRRH